MTNPAELDAVADGGIDETDVRVLRRLAAVWDTVDPVPSGLIDRISFGITLESLHAEIALLQRSEGLVGVRGQEATDAQTVTFTSASRTTMVTITPLSADRVRIDGWIAPGAAVAVELRIVGDSLSTEADADGRFVFDDVPRGLAQFVLRAPDGDAAPVVTPSIEL